MPAPPRPRRSRGWWPLWAAAVLRTRCVSGCWLLVAEQTGYPEDMLDLDLDLEADLGVDTVKQAELFATVREAYGIARDDRGKRSTSRPSTT